MGTRLRARREAERAFTLIEMLITIAIIGILAALAVPSLMKYVKKAKSAEARSQLEKLYNGARSYYYETTELGTSGSITVIPSQFPASVADTPGATCCLIFNTPRCPPSQALWDADPSWRALKFGVVDPHYFQYAFESQGTGVGSQFTAFAYGDLDCDGVRSTFSMTGFIDTTYGEPLLTAAQTRIRELE